MLLVLFYYVSSVYVLVLNVVTCWNLCACCVCVIITVAELGYSLPSEIKEASDIWGQHVHIACQK